MDLGLTGGLGGARWRLVSGEVHQLNRSKYKRVYALATWLLCLLLGEVSAVRQLVEEGLSQLVQFLIVGLDY